MDTLPTRQLVLIADDYDHVAKIMAELIEAASPFEAVPAKDGMQACSIAIKRLPFVCILDIDMPVMDGVTAARSLRFSLQQKCPVLVALTGGVALDEDEASRGLFDHILKKPLAFGPLLVPSRTAFRDSIGLAWSTVFERPARRVGRTIVAGLMLVDRLAQRMRPRLH